MFSKKLLATSVSAVTLALVGCGASDQDSGTSGSNVQLSGLVVDPYISGATVYVDLNNNGIRDSVLEAKAQTDKDGYFSKSKPDEDQNVIDYCADKQYERFCLRTPITASGAVLRIEGGYDVASGQPFKGSLVMPLDLNGQAQDVDAVNPLISLFASSTAAQQDAILGFIGGANPLTKDDLNKDFLSKNSSGDPGVDPEMFRRAMQIHKAVAIISAALEKHYAIEPGKEKDGNKLPGNAGKYAYDAVASLLAVTKTPSAMDSSDTDAIDSWSEALGSAENAVRDVLGSSDTAMAPEYKNATGERIAKLFNWLKDTPTIASDSDADDLNNNARFADFAVGQVTREIKLGTVETTDVSESVMGSAIKTISENTNSNFTVDTFSDETNLDAMISSTTVVDDSTTIPKILATAKLFTSTAPVAGQTLDMSYEESTDKNGQVKVFFNGTSGATSGTAALCVKAVGYDTDVKGLDEGQYVPGYWAKLNDYAFTLKFDLSGVPDQPLIVKRTAVDGTNGDTFQFSLESTGQLEEWTGTLTDTSVLIPTDNATCQSEFSS